MTLSTDERRALAIIAALLTLAALARWVDRPKPVLGDAPALDTGALADESRALQGPGKPEPRSRAPRPAASRTRTPEASRTSPPAPPARLDPNTATAAELDALPGIGPAIAQRIIEAREAAPFRTVGDLERVPGIGAALASSLVGLVTLEPGPATQDQPSNTVRLPELTVSAATRMASETAAVERADINHIGAEDLQKVPGIGPVLAARLIARRDSLRGFVRWSQVDSTAGVGPAMLSKLQDRFVLSVR